jgi:hypothetical protein
MTSISRTLVLSNVECYCSLKSSNTGEIAELEVEVMGASSAFLRFAN